MNDQRVPDPPWLYRRMLEAPLVGLLTPRDRCLVKTAYILAKHGHRWQERKDGGRYFDHPRDVAVQILLDELGVIDPVMIAAALLHDCPEDTRDIDIEMIEFTVGSEVARLVLQVSKLPKEGFYERLFAFGDPRALLLKAADRLHNLRTLAGTERAFIEKQLRQTHEEFLPLLDRLSGTVPPALAKTANEAVRLIHLELDALAMRLAAMPE